MPTTDPVTPLVTPLVTLLVTLPPTRPDPTRPGRYLRTYTNDQVSAPQLLNASNENVYRTHCPSTNPSHPQINHRPRARTSMTP